MYRILLLVVGICLLCANVAQAQTCGDRPTAPRGYTPHVAANEELVRPSSTTSYLIQYGSAASLRAIGETNAGPQYGLQGYWALQYCTPRALIRRNKATGGLKNYFCGNNMLPVPQPKKPQPKPQKPQPQKPAPQPVSYAVIQGKTSIAVGASSASASKSVATATASPVINNYITVNAPAAAPFSYQPQQVVMARPQSQTGANIISWQLPSLPFGGGGGSTINAYGGNAQAIAQAAQVQTQVMNNNSGPNQPPVTPPGGGGGNTTPPNPINQTRQAGGSNRSDIGRPAPNKSRSGNANN